MKIIAHANRYHPAGALPVIQCTGDLEMLIGGDYSGEDFARVYRRLERWGEFECKIDDGKQSIVLLHDVDLPNLLVKFVQACDIAIDTIWPDLGPQRSSTSATV